MAKLYTLSDEGYARAKRQVLTAAFAMALVLLLMGGVFLLWSDATGYSSLLPFVAVGVVAFFTSITSIRKAIASWKGYQLLISDNHVECRMPGRATRELEREQVRSILETPGHGLLVRGDSKTGSIFIPVGVDDYEAARNELLQWRQFTARPRLAYSPVVLMGGMLFVVPVMAGTYFSNDPRIAVPSAVLFACIMGWSAYHIKTHPDVDEKLRSYWWFIPLMIAGGLYRVYSLISS